MECDALPIGESCTTTRLRDQITTADSFVKGQVKWNRDKAREERDKREICKKSLAELNKPQTRLGLALARLWLDSEPGEFAELLGYLVSSCRHTVYCLRDVRMQLAGWGKLSPYAKAMFEAAAIKTPGNRLHFVTVMFTDDVYAKLLGKARPRTWVAARLRDAFKTIIPSGDFEFVLGLETTDKGIWHGHAIVACGPEISREQISKAAKRAGGKGWKKGQGYRQVDIQSVPNGVEAMKVCNYFLKESHDLHITQSVTRRARKLHEKCRHTLSRAVARTRRSKLDHIWPLGRKWAGNKTGTPGNDLGNLTLVPLHCACIAR